MTCCNMKHFLKNIVFLYAIVSSIKAGPDSASTSGITRPTPIQAKVGGGGNFDNSRSVIPTVNTAITITTSGGNTPPGPIQIVNKPACICIGDNGYKEKKHNAIFAIRLGKTGIGITLFGWKFGINIGGNEGNNHAIGINYGGKGGNNNSIGINFGGDVGNFNDIGVNIGQKGGNHLFYLGINLGPSYGTYGVGIDLGKLFKTGGSSTSTGGGGTTTHGSGGTVIFRIRLGKGGIGITIFNHEIGINFGGAKGTHGAIGINFGGTGGNVKPIGLNFGQTGGNQEGVGINVGGTGGNRGKYVGIQLGKTDGAGGIGIDFGKLLGADGKGGIFGFFKRQIQTTFKTIRKIYKNLMDNSQYIIKSIEITISKLPSTITNGISKILGAFLTFVVNLPKRIVKTPSFIIHLPQTVLKSTSVIFSQLFYIIVDFPKQLIIALENLHGNVDKLLIGNTEDTQITYNFNENLHYFLNADTSTALAIDISNQLLYLANGTNGAGFIMNYRSDTAEFIAGGSSQLTWMNKRKSWAKYFKTNSLKYLLNIGVKYDVYYPSTQIQLGTKFILRSFITSDEITTQHPIVIATRFAYFLDMYLKGTLKNLQKVCHGPLTLAGDLTQTESTYDGFEAVFNAVPNGLQTLINKNIKLNIKKILNAPCGINILSYFLKVFYKQIDSGKVFAKLFDTEVHFYKLAATLSGKIYHGLGGFVGVAQVITGAVLKDTKYRRGNVRTELRRYLGNKQIDKINIKSSWKFSVNQFYTLLIKSKLDSQFSKLSYMLKGLTEGNLTYNNINISNLLNKVLEAKKPLTTTQIANIESTVLDTLYKK